VDFIPTKAPIAWIKWYKNGIMAENNENEKQLEVVDA
jgi:hypothetical protein